MYKNYSGCIDLPVTGKNTSLVGCRLETNGNIHSARTGPTPMKRYRQRRVYLSFVYNSVIFRKPTFKDRSDLKHVFWRRRHILLCEHESKKQKEV